ncbi:AAA domain-containing protein [Brumicola blandensis]|uniref:AAA domain-containing protein n=1 Tax=Brumicola blandensis TaxID=3075611 RepID=A0AAW8R141_9ALTE|nr:AAA domain-containing protein [Alteromonas sp. W409]MDT0581992.1 AAA domain-containing protein [Alteromonas sp. W409]
MDNSNQYQKILLKGKEQSGVESCFHENGKYKVKFEGNDTVYTYHEHDVQIVESVLSRQDAKTCLEYLKELASITGLKVVTSESEEFNALHHYYSNISFVDSQSLLGAFLASEVPKDSQTPFISISSIYYPFGFNISQIEAVKNALNNRISIIEGPPGTGKTQTILNIIANVVSNGGSVAVVSSNNAATQNVHAKLSKYGFEFVIAPLGSKKNKTNFLQNQQPQPDLSSWKLSPKELTDLQNNISQLYSTLQAKLNSKVELSKRKSELQALELEYSHFRQQREDFNVEQLDDMFNIRSFQEAIKLWISYRSYRIRSLLVTSLIFVYDSFRLRKSRVFKLRQYVLENSLASLIEYFQSSFYRLKIKDSQEFISSLELDLEAFDFDKNMNRYTQLCMKVFRHKTWQQYCQNRRKQYTMQELKTRSNEFLKDYPVVLSTTYSVNNSLSPDTQYDYLIIDEASQVNICTGALALSCAKRVVVVGDTKQLTHVVDNKTHGFTKGLLDKFRLDERYDYSKQSLLSVFSNFFEHVPKTMLKEHYRCSPKIIEFCNQKFYGGELIVMTESTTDKSPLLVYKTVPGNHQRNRVNQRQIDVIKNEIIVEQNLNVSDGSIGIVTPYRSQTDQLQKAFEGTTIQADTVDKFQGREKDVVIISTVDNHISEFADERNRLNVAVSRAIDQLILVVSENDSVLDTNIGDLIKYIEYNNMTIVKSKVYSIFDYLYRSYANERQNYLKFSNRISEFDSENLMYTLIHSILEDEQLSNLGVSSHVPLNLIIRDKRNLSVREKAYAANQLTHVDFLIYDKASKLPKSAVEVDGVNFHKKGSLQAVRDKLKNSIFEKSDIPLLRFRTDGSGEEQLLRDHLRAL